MTMLTSPRPLRVLARECAFPSDASLLADLTNDGPEQRRSWIGVATCVPELQDRDRWQLEWRPANRKWERGGQSLRHARWKHGDVRRADDAAGCERKLWHRERD